MGVPQLILRPIDRKFRNLSYHTLIVLVNKNFVFLKGIKRPTGFSERIMFHSSDYTFTIRADYRIMDEVSIGTEYFGTGACPCHPVQT